MKKPLYFLAILAFLAISCILLVYCNKEDLVVPAVDPDSTAVSSTTLDNNDQLMNPGPDPEFVDYIDNSANLRYSYNQNVSQDLWERYMYIDKTDTIYRSTTATRRLAGYLRKYRFTGAYMYSTSGIVASSSNYTSFGNFNKILADSGIIYRAVVSGNSTTFTSSGNTTKFNLSQTSSSRRINRADLELEWWNGASSWTSWNTTNQYISLGSIPDNDFYEGWYKNMGSTIDTIAARDQVKFSDRILLHCYQVGIPTYGYANAKSTGATAGRLDIIARGARQAGKKIDLMIIISAEYKNWGASNTFTGPALQQAYNAGQANPFFYIENQAYNNIYGSMTSFQKQWINFKGFVWFTKRYCYYAVPPK